MNIAKRTTDEPIPRQRLLTLPEAAYYLGCTIWSVRDLIWKGELPYTRFGKRFQVDVRYLDAMIEREKRRESADLVRHHPSPSAAGFVIPSGATGDQKKWVQLPRRKQRSKTKEAAAEARFTSRSIEPLTGSCEKVASGPLSTNSTESRFAKIPTRKMGRCRTFAPETAGRN